MRYVTVPLSPTAREALASLALREMRHPRQQAALLITEALRTRGFLADNGPGRAHTDCRQRPCYDSCDGCYPTEGEPQEVGGDAA